MDVWFYGKLPLAQFIAPFHSHYLALSLQYKSQIVPLQVQNHLGLFSGGTKNKDSDFRPKKTEFWWRSPVTESFRYPKWRYCIFLRLVWGWYFPYISLTYSSILGSRYVWWWWAWSHLYLKTWRKPYNNWLVVSTHLKNISQNGNLPQFSGWKIKTYLKPPPR